MSKYIKGLMVDDIKRRLEGVQDAVLVNVIGLDSGNTFNLRKELRKRNLSLLVVKNSLASRATEGNSLFSGVWRASAKQRATAAEFGRWPAPFGSGYRDFSRTDSRFLTPDPCPTIRLSSCPATLPA